MKMGVKPNATVRGGAPPPNPADVRFHQWVLGLSSWTLRLLLLSVHDTNGWMRSYTKAQWFTSCVTSHTSISSSLILQQLIAVSLLASNVYLLIRQRAREAASPSSDLPIRPADLHR